MPKRTLNYGWIPQKPDIRDFKFDALVKLKALRTQALPQTAYLRRCCSEVTDQGNLGSCTANALTNLLEYNECAAGRGGALFQKFSRLFIYYNERVLENTVHCDGGAELRDGIKVLAAQGVCPESQWPYVQSAYDINPPPTCYLSAIPNRIHSYYALSSLNDMRSALANGRPFVFGFTVYDSFESDEVANTGVLNLPAPGEEVVGGHAVMAIGYDDTQRRFIAKNSWGRNWGLKGELSGYFTIPYDYLTNPNLASDFWTIARDP